jgi:hypothetical protein
MMLTEEQLRLEARLTAIEQLVAKTTAGLLMRFTDEQFEQLMSTYSRSLDNTVVPGLDPATADVFADQFREEMLRLLRLVRYERKRVPLER